jgi:hypothetical protein
MLKNSRVRKALMPLMFAGLAAPGFLTGCGDDPFGCEDSVKVRINAFNDAVAALTTASASMKASVGVACVNIAKSLGAMDVMDPAGNDMTDDELKSACSIASTSLKTAVSADATFAITVEGGECTIDASAQLNCEASCDVSGSCTPPSVEVACEAGKLSGGCTAECSGSCTVETGSVSCEGKCGGTCEGSCDGECSAQDGMGNCAGSCKGSCTGECKGSCEVVAPSASCSGKCTGGCSVDFQAPSCEGELDLGGCDIDADCSAGCNGEAKLEASCTPPKVVIVSSLDAAIVADLQVNLGEIFLAFDVKGQAFVDAALDVADKGVGVLTAATESLGCAALSAGADFSAAASASVSVSVSVEASASVGGSAGG